MPKVTAPLFSLSAKGSFGNVLTYVCGLYVKRAAQTEKFEFTEKRTEQQTKFSQAIAVWQSDQNIKSLWVDLAGTIKESGECEPNLSYYMTGYQTFMSLYLEFGPNGWINYPLPPS